MRKRTILKAYIFQALQLDLIEVLIVYIKKHYTITEFDDRYACKNTW